MAIPTIVLIISCSSDDGAIGPAGADGKDCTDEIDGNVNVTSILTENISLIKNSGKEFTIPGITQDILD